MTHEISTEMGLWQVCTEEGSSVTSVDYCTQMMPRPCRHCKLKTVTEQGLSSVFPEEC